MDPTGAIVEELLSPRLQLEDAVEEKSEGEPLGQASKEHSSLASSVTAHSSPPPPDRSLFSSDAIQDESELSSPPSSPPTGLPSPATTARKPTFSFLKRKRSSLEDEIVSLPLSDITPNACKIPLQQRAAKKIMTQMQIDLGGETRKACRACGMEYIPSVKEDAALHKEFCGMNVSGVEMGRPFLKDESAKRVRSEKAITREKDSVVMVDRKSSLAVRSKAKKVLDVVNAELSSTDIDNERLWAGLLVDAAERTGKRSTSKRKDANEGPEKRSDRFKMFLSLVDDRCVGFCLAEKITCAFPVVHSQAAKETSSEVKPASRSSSISFSTAADVALLGISRIWTSKSQRGQGLATDVLDCARRNFFYGIEVPKNLVAFSQPTESGGRLAERWFEAEIGWHVYQGEG